VLPLAGCIYDHLLLQPLLLQHDSNVPRPFIHSCRNQGTAELLGGVC
jgi:hypothetical protein